MQCIYLVYTRYIKGYVNQIFWQALAAGLAAGDFVCYQQGFIPHASRATRPQWFGQFIMSMIQEIIQKLPTLHNELCK